MMVIDDEAKPFAEEIAGIENALDTLVAAMVEQDCRPRPAGVVKTFQRLSLTDITSHFDETTPAQRVAEALVANPVREAMARAVRDLGKRLHEIGGMELMSDVCQRVADRDDANWGRRTDILDKRWDGVGGSATAVGWVA